MSTLASSFVVSIFCRLLKEWKWGQWVKSFVSHSIGKNVWHFFQDQNRGMFIPIWKLPAFFKKILLHWVMIVGTPLSPEFETGSMSTKILNRCWNWDRLRENKTPQISDWIWSNLRSLPGGGECYIMGINHI